MPTRYIPTDRHCFFCHVFYEQSLATDPSSTADETPLIPDLHAAYAPARFGSLDALVGRSMEARGLPYALPAYDPWNTLARFFRNTEVIATNNLPSVQDIITKRRTSLFGHVVTRRSYSGSSCTVPGRGDYNRFLS